MPPVTSLTIIYDAECGLCTRAKVWIRRQVPLVGLQFVAMASAEAKRRFPQLRADELAVVADTGEVWLGNRAWIVCLWALQSYRDLSFRLTSPLLSLMAREAFTLVSRNRLALSNIFSLQSEREIEEELRKVRVPRCQTEPQIE